MVCEGVVTWLTNNTQEEIHQKSENSIQWNLWRETAQYTTKKWSFKRDRLVSEEYLTIWNRTTAARRWSRVAGRPLVRGVSPCLINLISDNISETNPAAEFIYSYPIVFSQVIVSSWSWYCCRDYFQFVVSSNLEFEAWYEGHTHIIVQTNLL